ncbi:hypothetical protein [Azohydromonas sp.]|uniref:hypothetical protein n=1 Tax=Azohydromonas sp. TaxID=1872666 RepID=UPI002D1FB576|nr:hypothetical protein [Azohydromonas sp.]
MTLDRVDEAWLETQPCASSPSKEPRCRLCAEQYRLVKTQEVRQRRRPAPDWIHTDVDGKSFSPIEACGAGRLSDRGEQSISIAGVSAWCRQAMSDPFSYWSAYGAPHKPPAGRRWGDRLRWIRPIRLESLKLLTRTDPQLQNASIGHEHCRWRGDSNGAAVLQCRNSINGPPQTTETLRPIEAVGPRAKGRLGPFDGYIVDQQNIRRVQHTRRNQKDAFSALRQAKAPAIDNSVGPTIAAPFELGDDGAYRATSVELKHEGHVLNDDGGHTSAGKQPKDFSNQPGAVTANPRRPSRLAQVLAGEARADQLHGCGQRAQSLDVIAVLDAWKASPQHCLRGGQHVADEFRYVTGAVQSKFKAPYACKQSGDSHMYIYTVFRS